MPYVRYQTKSIDLIKEMLKNLPPAEDCLIWPRSKNQDGYGILFLEGRCQRVHRVAYEIVYGKLPACHEALHNCPGGDLPACFHPVHLWSGTHLDNVRDCIAKGRFVQNSALGMKNGMSRLTDDQTRNIRNLLAQGRTQASLADQFGVCQANISYILLGKTWKHI